MLVDFIFLAVFYVFLSPLLGMPFYNKLLFFPFDSSEDVSGVLNQLETQTHAKRFVVNIATASGQTLNGWYFKAPGASKVFVVSHGNGGNIKHRILLSYLLLKCGANVLVYDYEGFGSSTGAPSVSAIKEDGLAAYDYAHKQLGYKPEDIIAYGESLGSGVASYIAQNRKVAGVVFQSGFSSLSSAAKTRLPWMNLYPPIAFANIEMDNLSYVRGPHPPVLLVHGADDVVLPVWHSDTMFAQASQPTKYVKIKGAGHNDAISLDARLFATTMQSFVQSLP